MKFSLVQKYNVPGPRYTSYPTVPYWDNDNFSPEKWIECLQKSFRKTNSTQGISIYIHLPFCESLCTFCACNKRITKQHSVEEPYIETVLKEWKLYLELLDENPVIKEIHLGGGTPTFFSPKNLKSLIEQIFETAEIGNDPEFSFEGHPNNTKKEHLETLYELGFRRVSFGIQDLDPVVQKAIHRIQPFEKVKEVTEQAKQTGYLSVSHDLVFGLPHQTLEGMLHTIDKINELRPDRISFYSYAHVPWIKGVGQRGFSEADLPSAELKRALYERGKKSLEEKGYTEIGMDHFALRTDSMFTAMKDGKLHRNFMGYTSSRTQVMIGLGVSSISDSWYSFAQNVKSVEEYQDRIAKGKLAVSRGHILTGEDLIIRQHILNIMCRMKTSWSESGMKFDGLEEIFPKLKELENDCLIEIRDEELIVKEEGRPYLRNICMPFDLKMMRNEPESRIFSMTI